MSKKLVDLDFVTQIAGTNSFYGNFGGKSGQISIDNFRAHLNDNDEAVLDSLAFYMDINKASSKGSAYVDTGGNMNMRELWASSWKSILMDADGNWCALNSDDCRYTEEGDYLLNDDGTVADAWSHCDFMEVIPLTYGRVQTVTVGSESIQRLWLSLVPLPGGFAVPQLVVGKFKATLTGSGDTAVMRSLPGLVPANKRTLYGFWVNAQNRSKDHGLAGLDFRDQLAFYMMSAYGYRNCQNTAGADGTKVWGAGLDGTESTDTSTTTNKFLMQMYIKTGHTLSLGTRDGNAAVTDSAGVTCHGVCVNGFENPWGQYWEMVQGLCSVGSDVYFWRGNVMPADAPTADTFTNIKHVLLARSTAIGATGMNIISSGNGQGVYMIPSAAADGISYGDGYWYAASGQYWLFGCNSDHGAECGIVAAGAPYGWSESPGYISTRLAYYGQLNKVTAKRLAQLAA